MDDEAVSAATRPVVALLGVNAVLVVARGRRRARRCRADGTTATRPRPPPRASTRRARGRSCAGRSRSARGPPGRRPSRQLAERLRAALPNGRFEPLGPAHPGLRNVVGRLPGAAPAIAVTAHYDTKDLPGFVGANDGAAGTAAVVELARALAAAPRPKGAPELRFVLFDGEEATDDARPFEATGLRGSRAYAARHADELRALDPARLRRRPRHADPARGEVGRRRSGSSSARRRGAPARRRVSPPARAAITDDHVPFLRRGVPAIDLIEWPYACWHEPCDDLGAVSERSLDRTGETVLELVRTLSRT